LVFLLVLLAVPGWQPQRWISAAALIYNAAVLVLLAAASWRYYWQCPGDTIAALVLPTAVLYYRQQRWQSIAAV
jgi:hypothetical protein